MTIQRWLLAFAMLGYTFGHIAAEFDGPLRLLVAVIFGLIFGVTSLIAERRIHA